MIHNQKGNSFIMILFLPFIYIQYFVNHNFPSDMHSNRQAFSINDITLILAKRYRFRYLWTGLQENL